MDVCFSLYRAIIMVYFLCMSLCIEVVLSVYCFLHL